MHGHFHKIEKIQVQQLEFSSLLGLKTNGERTVRGWELGEHKPSVAKWLQIKKLTSHVPFKQSENGNYSFKFIDLFAGIGGIRIPYQDAGGHCVFSSEWDNFSQKTYASNFGHIPEGDITKIHKIPDHDLLLGGFPCQAFSLAGLRKGFNDPRGTLFFEIQKILATNKPKAFMLENVKQLKGHEKGKTLQLILDILEGRNWQDVPSDLSMSEEARETLSKPLNYKVFYKVLRATDFGVPQNRERIFLVGFNRDYYGDNIKFERHFSWPIPPKTPTKLGDILEDSSKIDEKYTLSSKLWEGHKKRKEKHKLKGNGFGYSLFNENSSYTRTLSARYYKDGSEILVDQKPHNNLPRRLTPRECARLQGFPENFIVDAVSNAQAYKQLGNSVAIPVVKAVSIQLLSCMNVAEALKQSGNINYDDDFENSNAELQYELF